MANITDKFYNMQVNLIKNGKIYAENVAIRNVWQKDSNTFFDIYFHRLKKSFVFDSVFIHDIFDISRDKAYSNIDLFIKDFYDEVEKNTSVKSVKPPKETGILVPVRNDLILLLFMAQTWGEYNMIKNKIIFDYVQHSLNNAKNITKQYLDDYMAKLQPEVDDFYIALETIKSKTPKQAETLLRAIFNVCHADGHMHYTERMYLADIVQTLRLEGMKIPVDLI